MKRHASMNRTYRLVWNSTLSAFIAVAENAKGRGKSGSARKLIAAALSLASAAFIVPEAMAGPTGGQISAGAGSIAQSGNTTTIIQSTQNLAINWQSFGISGNETVNFSQPNTSAIALNRVLGQNPSQILGSLKANGQVFVLNPNGVLFGVGAQVNVGGLVASTLGLSDVDFMAGKNVFGGNGGGSVVNQGTLTAAPGGYIAMLAPEVRNEGVISATLGTALLAAGNKVTLNLNNGSLVSYTVDQGALNALTDNKQLIQADGGRVFMSATAADALSTAVVNNTGIVQAHTIANVGGVIKLLGDMQVGTANVAGTLDASAPAGGNGGFVETSAARVNVADSIKVTTTAASGQSGSWLIDPADFTIAATSGNMTGAALSSALGTSAVTIQSSTGTSGTSGDVNVNDGVSWSAHLLTLKAQNNININAPMNATGTASLALQYGQASTTGAGSTYNVTAPVNLIAGTTNFTTQQGSAGAVKSYTVITALGAAGSTSTTDLQGISGGLTANYVLGADIDATPTAAWNAGAGFAPIGSLGATFQGKLDGLGHTISNLTISRPSSDYVGLVAYALGANLNNVQLVGGSVTGRNNVGALLGYADFATVSNSYATGSVTGSGFVGGLLGYDKASTVSKSYATGNVVGTTHVGGLVGWIDGTGAVSNSYASGAVIGYNNDVGGLAGVSLGTISNSYAIGRVQGVDSVGGLVGSGGGSGNINTSYATGKVAGTGHVGGLSGFASHVTNSYWDTTTTGQATSGGGSGLSTLAALTQGSYTGFDFGTTWYMVAAGTQYSPDTSTRPFLRSEYSTNIGNAHQLQMVNMNPAANYTLVKNLDLAAELANPSGMWGTASATVATGRSTGFTPIGVDSNNSFTGNFDGQNHTISNLFINRPGAWRTGLFGDVTGNLSNLGLLGGSVNGYYYVGELVGYITRTGTVSNSYATGNVSGSDVDVGGLVGNADCTVTNSYATGNVSGLDIVGGLVGGTSGGVSNSYATGNVTGSVTRYYGVGGLVGWNSGNGALSNTYATGNVSGGNKVGGLVGQTFGSVSSSYATGNVNGVQQVGGLAGFIGGSASNSYAMGSVTGQDMVGGFVGYAGGVSTTISNNYATGRVTGSTNVGGFLGSYNMFSGGAASNNYWDTTTTGMAVGMGFRSGYNIPSNTGATGLTTAAFNTASNFTGFTFGTVGGTANQWVIVDADGTLNNAGGAAGATRPMLLSEYSTSISTSHQLQLMQLNLAANYVQVLNLDVAATNGTANPSNAWGSAGFVPIGNSTAKFTGSFDGQSHSISNLTVNRPSTDYVGLFGYATGALANVGLVGGSVTGNHHVGGLVGWADGASTISNSYASGSVTGSLSDVGGLAGVNLGAISNSYATGSVTGTAADSVGGLVGSGGGSGSIKNSYATGHVIGATNVGGLSGFVSQVTSSYWDTTTTGQATSAGGGSGVSTAAMHTQANFSPAGTSAGQWNFTPNTGTWMIYEGFTAPLLRSFLTPVTVTTNSIVTTYTGAAYNGGAPIPYTVSPNASLLGTLTNPNAVNAGVYTPVGLYSNQQGYLINYSLGSLIINPAVLTYTGTASSKVYDGTTAANVTDALTGLLGSDSATASHTAATLANKNVGTGKSVSISGITVDNSNYQIANTATTTETVTAKPLTITATTDTKTYDGYVTSTATPTSSGLVGSDAFTSLRQSFASKDVAGTNLSAINVNSGYVIADGNNGANYAVTLTSALGTITKAPLVMTANDAAKILFDIEPSLTARYSGFVANESASVLTGIGITRAAGESAATYAITPTATSNNYSLTFTNGHFTVNPAGTLLIQLADTTVVYGSTPTYSVIGAKYCAGACASSADLKTLTVSLSGNTYTADDGLGTTLSFNVGSTGTTVGNYSITGSNTHQTGTNFTTLAFGNGNLAVTPLALIFTANAVSKEYDGGLAATGAAATLSNRVGNDVVNVLGTGLFANKNVGTGKSYTFGSLSLSGAEAVNYYLTTADIANGVTNTASIITPKTLTIGGITANNKTYNALMNATVDVSAATLGGLVSGDQFSVSATGTFGDKNVANGKAVTLASSYNGADVGNYSITNQATTTADITQKALTVGGITASNKTYNASMNATVDVSAATLNGLIANDQLSVSATGTFGDKNVANGKTVTLVSSYNGADVGNYSITNQATTTADITKAHLVVTADNQARWYGTENPILSETISGFAPGESLGNSGVIGTGLATTLARQSTFVGSAPITANAVGLQASNYDFSNLVDGVLTVKARTALQALTTLPGGANNKLDMTFITATANPVQVMPATNRPATTQSEVPSPQKTGTLTILNGGIKLPEGLMHEKESSI